VCFLKLFQRCNTFHTLFFYLATAGVIYPPLLRKMFSTIQLSKHNNCAELPNAVDFFAQLKLQLPIERSRFPSGTSFSGIVSDAYGCGR